MSDEIKKEETPIEQDDTVVESNVTESNTNEIVEEEAISTNEELKLDIVLENSKLENYETILEKFTDILTMTEHHLMVPKESGEIVKHKNIVNIGLEVYTAGSNFCEEASSDNLYSFIAKNFEYLGIYLFTFSSEESIVGILTNKIDNLLYDFIGNQEDLLKQFNQFQGNFIDNRDNDLKSLLTPLIFNLSNIGTNIACIKSILHYIKLKDEVTTESILENIILHIGK